MAKLVIKKEKVRFVERHAKIQIDNKIVGAIPNGGENVFEVSEGKHILLVLGVTDNMPKNQYEVVINEANNNIIEIKVDKKIYRITMIIVIFILILAVIGGIVMSFDIFPRWMIYTFGLCLVGVFYVAVNRYSKHMYSIVAISGVKLTPLTEDKKYR